MPPSITTSSGPFIRCRLRTSLSNKPDTLLFNVAARFLKAVREWLALLLTEWPVRIGAGKRLHIRNRHCPLEIALTAGSLRLYAESATIVFTSSPSKDSIWTVQLFDS